jgi:hypothetical protein
MKLFAQIRKVDEAKRLVYGRAAEEVVDKSDEIMDYASSKPLFAKWSEEIAKDTDGKSLGNLRAMHGKSVAGKLTGIDFNDAERAIDICAKVVDDGDWKKVLEGCYTGFSVGGAYVGDKKVEKMDGREVTRYTAKPNEISLVDRPCIPTAKFFDVQKADGTLSKVEFKAPAPEEVDGGTINGTPEQVDALVKTMAEHKLSLADLLEKAIPGYVAAKAAPVTTITQTIAPQDPKTAAQVVAAAAPVQKLDAGALRKSMWACSELAALIASFQSLQTSATYEAFWEGDDTGIAKKLGAVIALAGQVLIEMIQEEVAEGDGSDTTITVELAEKAKGLAKFEGEPIAALLKIGARNSKADKDRLAKIHDLAVELGHTCAAEKTIPAGELAKGDTTALEKMVADAVAPLQKALTEAGEKIAKLEVQPAPARVALRAVAKVDDTGTEQIQEKALVKDDRGEVHASASLIKSIHQSGGTPLRAPQSK